MLTTKEVFDKALFCQTFLAKLLWNSKEVKEILGEKPSDPLYKCKAQVQLKRG